MRQIWRRQLHVIYARIIVDRDGEVQRTRTHLDSWSRHTTKGMRTVCWCQCMLAVVVGRDGGVDYAGGGGKKGPTSAMWLSEKLRRNARMWGMCRLTVYVFKERGRGDTFSRSLCYQLSPKLHVVPPPAWQVISCYGDKPVTPPPLNSLHKIHAYEHPQSLEYSLTLLLSIFLCCPVGLPVLNCPFPVCYKQNIFIIIRSQACTY